MSDEFKDGLVVVIIFLFGVFLGNSSKEWEIYNSCEQKQEYRISDTEVLSCKATNLELSTQ